jgi:hypothetical protein
MKKPPPASPGEVRPLQTQADYLEIWLWTYSKFHLPKTQSFLSVAIGSMEAARSAGIDAASPQAATIITRLVE